ncbi:MAG: hypothetical protein MJZ76_04255 [Bacteroidales bacterium]|nr:hypothetical protein [Bacteroidales bacterium]
MENLEKLIKGKIEEKQYSYRSGAWKSFCKKANFSILSAPAKAGIIFAATGFVAGGIALSLNSSKTEPIDKPSPQTQLIIDSIPEKTEEITVTTTETQAEAEVVSTQTKPVVDRKDRIHTQITEEKTQQNDITPTEISKDSTHNQVKKTLPPKQHHWKVNIINMDTIR